MIDKTISHYKILEKLGEGGMGVVYKAKDTRLDRFVALKFLPHHLGTSEEEKKRFIQEAKAASALDHNNICNIHEIDETEDGQIFIAMACYDGETLKTKIERGPLPIEDAIDIAIQVAEGLTKAHGQDIVHRDMKPANVMVTKDGVVKIVDFGLAKLTGQTKLTKSGITLGTLGYMSPEQTQGIEVDHRTDIWSLGVVLYEMVTGQSPFKGDYEQAVMYSIMNEEPEPLTSLRTGVPIELERIVNKALAKYPDERYQHVDEMQVDLTSLAKKFEPGIARQPLAEIKPSARKGKFLYGAVVVSALLVLGGGIYFQLLREKDGDQGMVPGQRPEMSFSDQWQNSIAVLPFKNISPDPEQEYFCDGMTEQIITNLSQLQNLKVIARTSVKKFKNTEKTIPEIAGELRVSHILEGSIRKVGNQIRVTAQLIQADEGHHLWAKDYDRELDDIFAVQDDVSEAIARALLEELSIKEIAEIKTKKPSSTEAYDYFLKAQYFTTKFNLDVKLEDFTRAETMYKRAIELDPNYVRSYTGLTVLYHLYYFFLASTKKEKEKYFRLSEKYLNNASDLDPTSPEVFWVKANWANPQKVELDKRYDYLKKAIRIEPALFGIFLRDRGLTYQSFEYFHKAIASNPLDWGPYCARGIAYSRIGEYDKAFSDYNMALELEPDNYWTISYYTHDLILLKERDKAKDFLANYKELFPDKYLKVLKAWKFALDGHKENALKSLEESGFMSFDSEVGDSEASPSDNEIILYSLLDLKDKAIELLMKREEYFQDKSTADINYSHYLLYKNLPVYNNLRNDNRFKEILAREKERYEIVMQKFGGKI